MMKRNWYYWTLLPATAAALLIAVGCNSTKLEKPTDQAAVQANAPAPSAGGKAMATASDDSAEHGHAAGAHGGIMVSLGRDSYHVEAVVDTTGAVRLYTLGKDESRVIDVEAQTLKGFAKAAGDAESKPISFEPSPQDGDGAGKTSLFVGQLPEELIGRNLDVTIPNIRINGERFRMGFLSGQPDHVDSKAMFDKLADPDESSLYLTPGGRYTASDIESNGNVTASTKFKGIRSTHNMNPKPGDRVCPITKTLANPKFTWVVDGKSYQFCCPPCVDEFVKMAKASREPLPDPDTFVKQ